MDVKPFTLSIQKCLTGKAAGLYSDLLALTVSCALAGMPLITPSAFAKQDNDLQTYAIAAGRLSDVLAEFAALAGAALSFDPAQLAGRQSPGLQGRYSVAQGFSVLLQDSGYAVQRYEDGRYRLAANENKTAALPQVDVKGESMHSSDLPPAYAGGQVARGGRIGLLGNRDIFDTPFSVANYTAELIENQQARTVADVIRNDSSAQLISGRSTYQTIGIRGFIAGNTTSLFYDGLPRLVARHLSTVRILERVEIFKGPSALLNSTALNVVGGTINLVPKRPTETALTRLTADYDYKSRFGAHADLSRRFGSKKQFGARLNTIYNKGESAIEGEKEELGEVALALEYRTDKLRLETILDYRDRNLDIAGRVFVLDSKATSVPSAPDLDDDIQQPWARLNEKFARALLKAEYSLDKTWTIHAAYGISDQEEYRIRGISLNLNANGNFKGFGQAFDSSLNYYIWNAGIRGQFKTGEITHQLSVETTRTDETSRSDQVSSPRFNSNLYQPRFIARPQLNLPRRRNQPKNFESAISSIAIADTMGFFDERVLLTAGIGRQTIDNKRFNTSTGMRTSQYEKSANTPAVGLVVKPWRFMSIYGNYIEALEQGPTAPRTAANAGEVFPPNETEQIEFGMKFDLDGLGLTAGVFQIERPSGITDENRRFSLNGEQRNRGLELNAFGELRPDLRLLGGITYIDSELTRTQGGKFDGNDAVGVPELAAVLNLEWDPSFLSGLTLTARAEHRDSQYIRTDNNVKIPSYELYAIGARYKQSIGDQQFTFRMYIDNLLNKDYWNTFTGGNILYLGSPRRINLSMSMDF